MSESSLGIRVARLEALVKELHSALHPQATAGPPVVVSPAEPAVAEHPSGADAMLPDRPAGGWRTRMWDAEFWLTNLGVGLLLFGVTFLFRYSIEQGWLTPLVRVGFGSVLGASLLTAGLRMGEQHHALRQVLLGGGIATFYIVGVAAFQLYALVGHSAAFSFMAAVTVLAFALAVAGSARALSVAELRVYRFGVHLALLAWLWRELFVYPNGAAYVSAAWGLYGLALLVVGVRGRHEVLQKTALATLLAMVAKLFLVDLAALEALWRILLFLSVGGVFLLLSYLLHGAGCSAVRVEGS